MVKCDVLNDIEQRAACNKDSEGSHFFYLPIIIIVTVVIIIATVIIGFAVKTLAKHFHDNGIHHLDDSLRSPRCVFILVTSCEGLEYFLSGCAAPSGLVQPLLAQLSSHRRENRGDLTARRYR